MDVVEKRKMDHKKRVRLGYLMAIFCAIFWAIWYIPGNLAWELDPFVGMLDAIESGGHSSNAAMLVVAVLITGLNALTVVLALSIWNLYLGKFKEMKRTIIELKGCTKYYFFGAICGGPIAILGSFIAMGFIGGAFAAVAALAYPVIGTIVSSSWLGQKISRRALSGIFIIIIGSITIYVIPMISELTSGDAQMMGYIGGLMALCGWGIEGAVAAKGLDVSEPDVGIQIRFMLEAVIWWVIAIPVLFLVGFPMYEFAAQIFEPIVFLVLIMMGITFGFCYVAWYKSFPLIGVGRGQGIGSLYGIFAVIFIFMFTGGTPDWWVLAGGILCVAGTLIMFTENAEDLNCLRGEEEEAT
jgi:EamA-like transporter family.